MKAELNENGVMTITPESAMESYALKHWVEAGLIEFHDPDRLEHCMFRGSMLIVNTSVPD